MTKFFTIIALLVCSIQFTFAQTKGQLTALEEIGEGSVFQAYYAITKEGEKYYGNKAEISDLQFINNVNNKLSSFQLNYEGTQDALINNGFGYIKPNHYTEPSMFYSKDHRFAYIYIDGLLYCLKDVKDPTDINNIAFHAIFVLKEPKKGEHLSGKLATKELRNRNHEEVIKNYLNEMKVIQANATANFTNEIKAEIAAVENKEAAVKAENQAKNDAYWQSEQGQKVLSEWGDGSDKPSKVTISNTGRGSLTIIRDNGMTNHINGGSKTQLSCKDNIYYAVKDSSGNFTKKGQLISGSGNNCGETVSASADN